MKKYISMVLLFTVILTLTACGKSEKSASVDSKFTAVRTQYNSIMNETNLLYLKSSFAGTEAETEYKKTELPVKKEEVTQQIERDLTIISECKKHNILITEAKAQEYADTEYENIKSDAYYSFLTEVLTKRGITEKEYIEMMRREAYYKYNYSSFQIYFNKNLFDSKSKDSLSTQIEQYINK